MNKLHPIPSLLLGLGLATAFLQADTLAVLPGTSIQAKIDEAVDGDIIAIFGGVYNQSVVVNKAVRLVELNGQEVTIAGELRFEGVADCPPFDGFTVSTAANRQNVVVNNTTGLVISNLDHTGGYSLQIHGNSQVEITDSSLSHLESSGNGTTKITDSSLGVITIRSVGQTEIARSTAGRINQIEGSLVASDVTLTQASPTSGGFTSDWTAVQTVLYRVKTLESEIHLNSRRNWVGYCQIKNGGLLLGWHHNARDGARKFVVVGTEVDRAGGPWERSGVIADGRAGSFVIANCWIHGIKGHLNDSDITDNAITVANYNGHPLLIQNNHLEHVVSVNDPYSIRVTGGQGSSKVRIRNNYMVNDLATAVYAQFGAVVQGNVLRGTGETFRVYDGVTIAESDANIILAWETDPGFELVPDPADPDGPGLPNVYRLAPDSVLRDTGTPNPLYNDRDGSRNDAGASGGAWYDPEGWTTDKPVVISFDLTPELILEGVNAEVTVDEVKAVSAP